MTTSKKEEKTPETGSDNVTKLIELFQTLWNKITDSHQESDNKLQKSDSKPEPELDYENDSGYDGEIDSDYDEYEADYD